MLDTRADFRFGVVGPPDRPGHSAPLGLLAVNAAGEAVLLHERLIRCRPIGGIGPDATRRIGLIEQSFTQPGPPRRLPHRLPPICERSRSRSRSRHGFDTRRPGSPDRAVALSRPLSALPW